ncbi:hypothetical protein, partial [Acinetobacter baumannii]|uniref:hypothetical protein n=1 Tax=Acinetobacter baumannii TaxID=470 RepID=UPI0013D6477E
AQTGLRESIEIKPALLGLFRHPPALPTESRISKIIGGIRIAFLLKFSNGANDTTHSSVVGLRRHEVPASLTTVRRSVEKQLVQFALE